MAVDQKRRKMGSECCERHTAVRYIRPDEQAAFLLPIFSGQSQYSTATGMTFQSNGLGAIGESTLAELITAAGSQEIEMISVQTDSGWDGFDGYMDGLEITLTNTNVGQVNFVPEPATLGVLLIGSLALLRRRKK